MDRLFKATRDLRRRLKTTKAGSQVEAVWCEKRKGWRMIVVRLSDAQMATKYVQC